MRLLVGCLSVGDGVSSVQVSSVSVCRWNNERGEPTRKVGRDPPIISFQGVFFLANHGGCSSPRSFTGQLSRTNCKRMTPHVTLPLTPAIHHH
ncbi:hypothetical protein BU24DRAFT_117588 [Aaosphaeria arxii CBS 175.79]|uniref:Uncharacterized protein n=1 Tax=Aaosphaeria arxii CBS 175.79 TaxID=1450172 RepID=A0A6A5Y1I1_9PLEO|nr:uncharacterized protein BU24DRAFT_117588 [Aaosphaeria arxii CBS 175.79]KAF2019338.1 hypothetical protein BU24DRAFT_117588 [Aaosphaeria arxii CBS 175.79]